MMINLIYENENAFVYKIGDWEKLRKEYRIIGEMFGSTQYVPVLPLKLMPEEALLLINKQIAKLVQYPNYKNDIDIKKFTTDMIREETLVYKKLRAKQMEIYGNQIVEKKQKKGDTRSKDEILQEEIDKVNINEDNMIWPIFLDKENQGESVDVHEDVLLNKSTSVRIRTFASLWEKGYYITNGSKFGGDFLVYPGDPIVHHANYIVRCLDEKESIHSTELITLGRLATSVKKRGLLASIQNDEINFITISWIDQ